MPCCDTGRNIQKYKGAAASTLQDVTDNGNTTTGDIITTTGYFIGDGSKLTGISGASAAFTLQETSDRGNTTSNVIQFTNTITSFTTSGNVTVAGNVTASSFYGLESGLSSLNASNISSGTLSNDRLDTKTGTGNIVMSASPTLSGTITGGTFSGTHTGTGSGLSSLNASNISSGTLSISRGGTNITTYTKGDILIASATDTLSNLSLGTGGYVLTSNSTSGLPEWKSSSDLGTQVAQLSNSSYILGGAYNGIASKVWSVQASTSNTADYIVARDSSGDIFVSNVNAIQYYGDGGTLSNIVGSQNLQDVINQNPYTNSPPYFGAGSYGAIYGSNTINASTISTTTGFYGPIKGSNTITTSGVYGPIYGSNTINAGTISTATGFYGPINGSNTISGTTLNVDSLISDDASAINKLNASNVTTGTLSVDYGGTNITTYAKGDILIASATDTLSNLSLGTGGYVLTSNSTSGLPEWKSSSDLGTQVAQLSNGSYILGGSYNGINPEEWSVQASTSNTADYIVARDSSGDIFVSNVNAINIRGDGSGITNSNASDIGGGTLAVARGGTGFTSYAIGDILYASSPSVLSNLAPSTTGYFLRTNGTGFAPTWENVADIGSATPANLYTDDYITGGPWSGLTDANIRVLGNVSNLSNQLVARDDKGDIFVSKVNAIKIYGDGTSLNGVALSADLVSNVTRIGNLESNLAANVIRIGNLESNLEANSTRITNLQNSTIISNSSGITDAF